MSSPKPINLATKFALFQKYWSPRIVAELNDLFLVVKGNLKIRLRDGKINLKEGELVVISKGVEHLPIADDEVHVMLLEPKTTVNTSDVKNERTTRDNWI